MKCVLSDSDRRTTGQFVQLVDAQGLSDWFFIKKKYSLSRFLFKQNVELFFENKS